MRWAAQPSGLSGGCSGSHVHDRPTLKDVTQARIQHWHAARGLRLENWSAMTITACGTPGRSAIALPHDGVRDPQGRVRAAVDRSLVARCSPSVATRHCRRGPVGVICTARHALIFTPHARSSERTSADVDADADDRIPHFITPFYEVSEVGTSYKTSMVPCLPAGISSELSNTKLERTCFLSVSPRPSHALYSCQ